MLTHLVSVGVTQQTPIPDLLGYANLNYGRGNQVGSGSPALSYDSWGGTGGLMYRLTPKTFLGLTYSYSIYDRSFGGQNFTLDRQFVQISLAQAFY